MELDIGFPEDWEALRLWGEGHGYEVEISQAGRYAQALLGRLGRLQSLRVLANEDAVTLLAALSPLSRKKLAQKFAAEQSPNGTIVQRLVDQLRKEPLWIELQSRTLGELVSIRTLKKNRLLPVLGSLVESGLVLRGRSLRCPVCNYPDWIGLRELDERLQCRACNEYFPLPTTDAGRTREAETAYRLDGLMARCMDQDLLPVLLSLSNMASLGPSVRIQQAWPGLEIFDGTDKREVDLLVSTGRKVTVFECKANARSMSERNARALINIARGLAAIPTVAALDGEFSRPVRDAVESHGGVCLEKRHLLSRHARDPEHQDRA